MITPVEQAHSTQSTALPGADRSGKLFWAGLGLIGLVAAALRLIGLDVWPQLFDQDEMVLGYDAWSLWTTLKDQHGNLLPVHFQTFNDFVPPVANYLAAPFVGLLGLGQVTVRLPFALLGVATVVLTGLTGRRWFGAGAGLVAAGLLAAEPWHLQYSRIAYPASLVPFFITAGLYSYTRAMEYLRQEDRTRPVWLGLSAASFALLTCTYPPLKLEAPLLLGGAVAAALPLLWRRRGLALAWLGLYGLLISPLLITQFIYWDSINLHFKQLTVLDNENAGIQFFRQWGEHYSPAFLFVSGYRGGYPVRPAGIAELFWPEGFLWLAALVGLARPAINPRPVLPFKLPVLLGVWMLTFPLASSLTDRSVPHQTRALNFLPLPQLLAGFGAVVVWQGLSAYRWRKIQAAWVGAAVGVLLLGLFQFIHLSYYFGPLWAGSGKPVKSYPYNIGLGPVAAEVARQVQPCDVVYQEPENQAYIYYLFYSHYPPDRYQLAAKDTYRDEDGWTRLNGFDNIRFVLPDRDRYIYPAECEGRPGRLFFLTRTVLTGPEWQEVAVTRNAAGQPIWRAVVRQRL